MATLKDVALRAGVSISTVSRVLASKDVPISENTKLRIRKAAEEVGYLKGKKKEKCVWGLSKVFLKNLIQMK